MRFALFTHVMAALFGVALVALVFTKKLVDLKAYDNDRFLEILSIVEIYIGDAAAKEGEQQMEQNIKAFREFVDKVQPIA